MKGVYAFVLSLFLLVMSGCGSVNVCIDDGFCSTRELTNGDTCIDCIQGPFIPKELAGLNYFSQIDIEGTYGASTANNVAQNYIGTSNPKFVLYADTILAVINQTQTKTIVLFAQSDTKSEAQAVVDSLIAEKYSVLDWSLTTYGSFVYYTTKRQSAQLNETMSVFIAGTDVYLLVSENNDDGHDDILAVYLEKYATEKSVITQIFADSTAPELRLPVGVTVVVSNISTNSVSLPNGTQVFRILDIVPSDKITNIAFSFQLPKVWVDAQVSSPGNITTLLSDDGVTWEHIDTKYVGEVGAFYRYTVVIPHFSMVAIGASESEIQCQTGFTYDTQLNSCVESDLCSDTMFYDSGASGVDDSCVVFGCTDSAASNYDSQATVDDGSCSYDTVGCTDPSAYNWDPAATISDDDSCEYLEGCTDSAAYNFDESAQIDDNSCVYALCYEFDGGNVPEIAGTTTHFETGSFSDVCIDDSSLKEYYCSVDDTLEEEVVDCEDGFECCPDAGACSNPAEGTWPISGDSEKCITSKQQPSRPDLGGGEHKGIDIRLSTGDSVVATRCGEVDWVAYDGDGYGHYVRVEHPDGSRSLYAHLSSVSVEKGDVVSRGEELGKGGNTGFSTNPHLHYEEWPAGLGPLDFGKSKTNALSETGTLGHHDVTYKEDTGC